ncbi:MAG: sugar phosphate isomerase/epimerase [Kiritimatiellae bacterium]|nr:sugar phosphate isomerase/epimerase [Kiritimatiellia bacterium]
MKLAVQMYTLRRRFTTGRDAVEVLERVREVGYRAIQLFGSCPLPAEELRRVTDRLGLEICGRDVPLTRLRSDLQTVIREQAALDCRYVTDSYPGADYGTYATGMRRYAADLTAVAQKLREAGLAFAYHNHSFEMQNTNGGALLDRFYRQETSPAVLAEIDTYWIQHGGGDPAQWIRNLSGRVPIIHLKDMKTEVVASGTRQVFAEVGRGNMNWGAILDAACEAGVQWCAVEQDVCGPDPLESVALSYRYLKAGFAGCFDNLERNGRCTR